MNQSALRLRANVVKSIRDFFWEQGFLEVETPLLIPANIPEEHINPVFTTSAWQLQTSPEICMKRLLSRGHQKLFQISHCWREAERGSRHLSEFTMLEWYRSGEDYRSLMADCKNLLQYVVSTCKPDHKYFEHNSAKIDPFLDWNYLSVQESFEKFAQRDVYSCLNDGIYEEVLTSVIEPGLAGYDSPVILMDYPLELASLAKIKTGSRSVAERFELYVGGIELANGFSELNDPVEQNTRFDETNRVRNRADNKILPKPEPFLDALASMPPSAGIALGIDRLVMLTAGVGTIDEVVAFTPEEL